MATTLRPCLDDATALLRERICLAPVSKTLRGRLSLLESERQECDGRCVTLKTEHVLRLEARSNEECDSEAGRQLDGRLVVRSLVTALADGTGEGRGVHTGAFRWSRGGLLVQGQMSGMTNVGTHHEPISGDCQRCHDPGYMEGRLCGDIMQARDPKLVGCTVTAAYRLQFQPTPDFEDTDVRGTLEGLVVCRCGAGACLDLRSFPVATHANPWTVGGHTFHVLDFSGALTPGADVVTLGAHTGLNPSYTTRVDLGAPVSAVDITLVHLASPATVTALDAGGAAVDAATMTVGGVPETLHLTGPIVALVVSAPNDETLILEICVS